MSAAEDAGFPQFARLHAEIRGLIWELYFSAPRIHLIQYALPVELPEPRPWSVCSNWSQMTDEEEDIIRPGTFLTWTCLDAATNQTVPNCLRSDINREAHSMSGKFNGRTRLSPTKLRDRAYRDKHSQITMLLESPVDVDWTIDLMYVYSPKSFAPLMGIGRLKLAQEIQRLAFAVPFTCTSPGRTYCGRDDLSMLCDWIPTVKETFDCLQVVTIVTLPPPKPEAEGGGDREHVPHSACPRDKYGFATVMSYSKKVQLRYDSTKVIDDTRISIALKNECASGPPKKSKKSKKDYQAPVVKRVVDADLLRAENGKYDRRLRC